MFFNFNILWSANSETLAISLHVFFYVLCKGITTVQLESSRENTDSKKLPIPDY